MIEVLKQYQVVLYNEEFFELGKGSFGKCYLGKILKK
jgi:hypothetical protein